MLEDRKLEEIVEILNTIILSMATKQKVFDSLNSEIFNCSIYSKYIELLIDVNLKLLDRDGNDKRYSVLVDRYLNNEIDMYDIIDIIKE